MATKPTPRIPVWASGGSTTDPGAGKEAAGWLVDERPPANWWNWIWNAMGQWLGWAETSIDDLENAVTIRAHGRVSVNLSTGNVTVDPGSFNIDMGETSNTNRLVVAIDAPLLEGWVAIANTTPTAVTPFARFLVVGGHDDTTGVGGAGTRNLVIDVYEHDGTAVDIDGGGSGTMFFEVAAIGSV